MAEARWRAPENEEKEAGGCRDPEGGLEARVAQFWKEGCLYRGKARVRGGFGGVSDPRISIWQFRTCARGVRQA